MERRERVRPPTWLEYFYQRQALQLAGIETDSLPKSLAVLTHHIGMPVHLAHRILEDHAVERVERDHSAYRDEDLKAQYAREMVRRENQKQAENKPKK